MDKKVTHKKQLEELSQLIEEAVEDNTLVVNTLNRVLDSQTAFHSYFSRELDALRNDFKGMLLFRTLKDLCSELVMPLGAMETMLEREDFSDPDVIRDHVESLVITLRSILGRMGAEKVAIAVGEEQFDPNRHLCVRLVAAAESPFPSASPRTIIRIVEDGYTLAGKPLMPAKVEVQAEQ